MRTKKSAAKPAPRLLSGGNPQVSKGDGDQPTRDYIAAMPGWKREVGTRLNSLIEAAVPGVRKAVRWNSPFYGVEGKGWFLGFHCMTKYIKVSFFKGASLKPLPPIESKHGEVRYLHIQEGQFDEKQFTQWVKQASRLDGWDGSSGSAAAKSASKGAVGSLVFRSRLESLTDEAEYYGISVPVEVTRRLKTLAAVPVSVRINQSSPFRSSFYPVGGGRHYMRVKASVRKEVAIREGDTIEIEAQILDRADRTELPDDLHTRLRVAGVLEVFESMPPGMRNHLIHRIEEVAKVETRKKRVLEAVNAAHDRARKQTQKRG